MNAAVGIDFGTTNSAIAVGDANDGVRLLPLPSLQGTPATMWRTILFFEPGDRPQDVQVSAGMRAVARYVETDGQGRLVQSIKSHLASELFPGTQAFGRRYRLEDLTAIFLREMRAAVPIDLGRRAVVGRPVRYWGARTQADDERALDRMRVALGLAGFDEVVFVYEPVAAAHRYATRLVRQEVVLIADFGGGTSDFSLVRVQPGAAPIVLAASGVGVAGDSFDARLIDHAVSPSLGRDSTYLAEFGRRMPVPPWLYTKLRRWHQLSFLRTPETLALLDKVLHGAEDPAGIERLLHVIQDELGFYLHRSVEQAKRTLSAAPSAQLAFDQSGVRLGATVDQSNFERWIGDDLAAIEQAIDAVMEQAQLLPAAVDRVFTTGGSSLVPAVRRILTSRFGADRVEGGEELTSVALGLASYGLSAGAS